MIPRCTRILSIALPLMFCVSVYANDVISTDSVAVTSNRGYSAAEVLDLADDEIALEDSLKERNDWVWMTPNTADFLKSKTGTEFMNSLYPSGLRLPTMLIDPSDAFYNNTDYYPIVSGNGARLLRIIGEGRVNYTYSEIQAANKYFELMKAKSIALGLPVFSFTEEYVPQYSNELKEKIASAVIAYEKIFGPIGFPNTSGLSFDWCKLVQDKYKFSADSLILSGVDSFEYEIPKGSKTIETYSEFRQLDPQEIYDYYADTKKSGYLVYFTSLQNYIGANEIDDIVEGASSEVTNAYTTVCGYYGFILNHYTDLYSNIHIGKADIVSMADLLSKATETEKGSKEKVSTEKSGKYDNDPFITAIQGQSNSSISFKTLAEAEQDNSAWRISFHTICVFVMVTVIIGGLILKIVGYLRDHLTG